MSFSISWSVKGGYWGESDLEGGSGLKSESSSLGGSSLVR
jgi:hypothetical protein